MDLNSIPTSGSWINVAELLNDNFNKISTAITSGLGGDDDNPNIGYVLPVATEFILGGIKLGSSQNYPLKLDSENRAYVNVPIESSVEPISTESILGLFTEI